MHYAPMSPVGILMRKICSQQACNLRLQCVKSLARIGFSQGNHYSGKRNVQNYQSACPWDIYSLTFADEMLREQHRMPRADMDELHLRIARVTEDLRNIQQELNCAAMQAPSDPELMEALNSDSETEPIESLRVALDQMRHFLWFYSQVMSNEPEFGDKLRQSASTQTASDEKPTLENRFLNQLTRADEMALLRHLAENKQRKPN
jgi:hypothetical protein